MTRRAAAIAALLILGGCNQGGHASGGGQDKYAGLDSQILNWRSEIVRSDPLCQSQAEGQKCTDFEVACKAERDLTPEDQSKGVVAKVVAAMNWNGWDPKLKQSQMGAKASQFSKVGQTWTRTDHAPVNMTTCADL